jgi:hypothetical protein
MSIILGASSGLPKLAPDLTFPSSVNGGNTEQRITGINCQGSLQTALSMSGKFAVSYLIATSLTNELITVKLTIDGVVIWNDTYTLSGGNIYFLNRNQAPILVENSLLLEFQTATDTSFDLRMEAQAIS